MELDDYKHAQRQAWEAGHYPTVAGRIEPAARALVEATGVAPGQSVLDVATGSGSVAIAAARAGADVLGVDHTDAWFDDARRRAGDAGARIDLRVGDAEALPVADGAYDRVLSSFGAIFAPRHELVAAELVRACRPGGEIGLTAWAPGRPSADVFGVLAGFLPEPPAYATPFIAWGDPEHVRGLFAPHGVVPRFAHRSLVWNFPSYDDVEVFLFTSSGPFIAARGALEELGRWDEALAALRAAQHAANEAQDGTVRFTLDYLVVTATRPA